MGYAAAGLVKLEVDLDVQIDSDGFAMPCGGRESVLHHRVDCCLIECERGRPLILVDCVCDGFYDTYVLWIALGVYDDGHGCNSGDLLLSRNFSEFRFWLVEDLGRGDAFSECR